MANVYTSASHSASSVFDVVTTTAETVASTIRMGARAVSVLDDRVDLMHTRTKAYVQHQKLRAWDVESMKAARDHVDMMEELHYYLRPSEKFDREAEYLKALDHQQKALSAE